MNTLTPHYSSRLAYRAPLCGLAACALWLFSACVFAADLSGYWTLDIKRTKSWSLSELTDTARQRAAAFIPTKHDPTTVCMPYGMPRVMSALGAFPMEIVQTKSQVTMIFDAHDEVRRIFLSGQGDRKGELAPLWLGYASGKWEGATLVVETVGITDQSLVSDIGIPHSGDLRVIERLRRVDANTLLDEITLHDAQAFIKPIEHRVYYTRVPEFQQREFHCAEQMWLDHVMSRAKELTRELAEKKP